jgi:hypothetical protein
MLLSGKFIFQKNSFGPDFMNEVGGIQAPNQDLGGN